MDRYFDVLKGESICEGTVSIRRLRAEYRDEYRWLTVSGFPPSPSAIPEYNSHQGVLQGI